MNTETKQLAQLRTLIIKSQCEELGEDEIVQLNELMQSEGGADEAAALIDQLTAFTDSGSFDSLPMTEVLMEAMGPDGPLTNGPPSNGKHAMTQGDTGSPDASAGGVHLGSVHLQTPSQDDSPHNDSPAQWSKTNVLLALVASHLLIASLAWSFGKPATTMQSANMIELETHFPELVSMTACIWRPRDDSNHTPVLGQSIQAQEVLELVEGIAELRIGEGSASEALVRVEGPASIFIRGDGMLDLRHGNLTAKTLGAGSRVVTINTPLGAILVDAQSSIGLVANGDVHELHVFAGQAAVIPSQGSASVKGIRLEEAEAVRFTAGEGEDYGILMFKASLTSFVSARSSGFDPLGLNQEYAQAVLQSKPSIYWRFEETHGEFPQRVSNLGSMPNMDAIVIGESGWRKYGQNRVAEIGKLGTSSGFRSDGLWPSEELNEYTVELWMKPELYHHGEILCLHESLQKQDGRYPHSMLLETLAHHWNTPLENLLPNRLRFLHRTPASGVVAEGSNLVGGRQYAVRTWQHVAAQKKGNRVTLWVDGQLSAEQFDASPMTANMQIVLGQLYIERTQRRFVGQIDEVAFYDRCLTPRELRGHIRAAGRPIALAKPGITTAKPTAAKPTAAKANSGEETETAK